MQISISVPAWVTAIYSDLSDWHRNPNAAKEALEHARDNNDTWQLELPDDVYFEYAFVDGDGEQHPDPNNDRQADNPWYPAARVITGSAYHADPHAELTRSDPDDDLLGDVRRGRLESRYLAERRRYTIYTPKGHEGAPLPTVYVQDGVAYYRYAKLHVVLEALIREGAIRPAHLVFIEPNDRNVDYSFNEHYWAFVEAEVIAAVEDTVACDGERIAMGASLGAFVSACIARHMPHLFATVVAQSGAFLGTPEHRDAYAAKDSWLLEAVSLEAVSLEAVSLEVVQPESAESLRWYLSCGTLDWLLDVNRNLAEVLQKSQKNTVRYVERSAGHNWATWKDDFAPALMFALGRD
jgi:enterochelin esterase family protein